MKKIACIATHPPRKKKFITMLKSICSQMDEIMVYFNDYSDSEVDEIIGEVTAMKRFTSNLTAYKASQYYGDTRDFGKIVCASDVNEKAYLFLIDDDIIYPEDYTSRMIKHLKKFKCVSTVHGRIIKTKNLTDYFRDTLSFNYRRALEDPTIVHIPGTGTVAFDTSILTFERIGPEEIKRFKGMCDIFVGLKIRELGLPLIAIDRSRYWLKDADPNGEDESLYNESKDNNQHICNILNNYKW